jgi:hypothetical protein
MLVKILDPLDSFVGWLNAQRTIRFIVELTPEWMKGLLGVLLIFLSAPIWLPIAVGICFVQSACESYYVVHHYISNAWERSK